MDKMSPMPMRLMICRPVPKIMMMTVDDYRDEDQNLWEITSSKKCYCVRQLEGTDYPPFGAAV